MNRQSAVVSVHRSDRHAFSKERVDSITLLEGLGVEGDAHCGSTVQHRYDKQKNPTRPNLRQVHLIHAELLDDINRKGFQVRPGDLGENISTRGIDLLGLPAGTRLGVGEQVVVEVTGLRSPCVHIERFRKGLLAEMVVRTPQGVLIRKAGIMAVVVRGGVARSDDAISVVMPEGEHVALQPV